ncbi:leucoanthocyanidin reductase [Cocos nucifera]|uniref:Leucoanthocyanidin reductase n=1 Tax=Cocos nucifera TaxID=13894 RepID=A0A8K0I359_COCNU|nr:leucoanthocyanidin reductase [Cocos nucifera]
MELVCSKVTGPALIVGATGYIGRFVADACLDIGRTTYVLVRPGSVCPARAAAVHALRAKGAIVVEGSVSDKELLERKLREEGIEVVISVLGGSQILDQLNLIDSIKAVGTIKRFLPSEFGHDIDKANPVEPGLTFYEQKRKVRRAIEAMGIPYTYICCNSIAGWPYHDNTHPSEVTPPLDRFQIYGDGNVKAFFVAGSDIGRLTVKAAYDFRTLNKTVHFRPTHNLVSLNEMAALWESKIGRTLPRATLAEEDLLAMAEENCIPASIVAALTHDIFINGCQINFSIDGCKDVEVTSLYPDISFRTIDECFDEHAADLVLKQGNMITSPNSMVNRMPVAPTCA